MRTGMEDHPTKRRLSRIFYLKVMQLKVKFCWQNLQQNEEATNEETNKHKHRAWK